MLKAAAEPDPRHHTAFGEPRTAGPGQCGEAAAGSDSSPDTAPFTTPSKTEPTQAHGCSCGVSQHAADRTDHPCPPSRTRAVSPCARVPGTSGRRLLCPFFPFLPAVAAGEATSARTGAVLLMNTTAAPERGAPPLPDRDTPGGGACRLRVPASPPRRRSSCLDRPPSPGAPRTDCFTPPATTEPGSHRTPWPDPTFPGVPVPATSPVTGAPSGSSTSEPNRPGHARIWSS